MNYYLLFGFLRGFSCSFVVISIDFFFVVLGALRGYAMVDPSALLGTPVRAGPNGVDRVFGDKGRRVMDIFWEFARPFTFRFV